MVDLVPCRSKGDNRATGRLNDLGTMVKRERARETNLDSEGERGYVETIKHGIVAPHQTGKTILDGISEGDATATF